MGNKRQENQKLTMPKLRFWDSSFPFPKTICWRSSFIMLFCLAIFLSRCIIQNIESWNEISPNLSNKRLKTQPQKPSELWPNQIRQLIISRGHTELLPLMERFDRPYQDYEEELFDLIREKYLIRPPREENGAYWHMKNDGQETSMGQAQTVIDIFKNKTNGFFVECGALDGELRSNTLTLEREYGWRGVLIEADPENLLEVVEKRRRAWIVPACLATKPTTMEVQFRAWGNVGSIMDDKALPNDNKDKQNMTRVLDVVCLPFYAIMKALDQWKVDYLSLDVEGNELDILKTIPFDRINVKVISAEFFHSSENGNSKEDMKNFMESKGYIVHSEVVHPDNLANDFIFVQKNLDIDE